jgi:hypothetical protein
MDEQRQPVSVVPEAIDVFTDFLIDSWPSMPQRIDHVVERTMGS